MSDMQGLIRKIPEIPTGAVSFQATAPSIVAPNEEFEINIAAIRIDGYPDIDFEGCVSIQSTDNAARIKKHISFRKEDHGTYRLSDQKLCTPGVHRITVRVPGSNLSGVSNPIKCSEEKREYNLYWGDIHVHNPSHDPEVPSTQIAESWDVAYTFGRYVSNVNFAAVADHAYILDDEKWQTTKLKVEEYNKPGEFVTFLGFESSHRTEKGGDINVYYLEDGEFRNFLPDDGSLDDLWQWLKDQGKEFITIPHHTARFLKSRDWSMDYYGGPEVEPVYEVYSRWGTSEFQGNPRSMSSGASDGKAYYRDALNRGYKLGVIAGSDDHDSTPGRIAILRGRRHFNGLAAIYAKKLTRKDLWESLKKRRCYGTSIDRILLDFRIDGHFMGEEIQSKNPEIMVEAYGARPFIKVEIVKNGKVIYRHKLVKDPPKGKRPGMKIARISEVKFSFKDHVENDSYYYLRVEQSNGEMAWSSPIWVRP